MRTLARAVSALILTLYLTSSIGAAPVITDELTYTVWQPKSLKKAPKRIILQHFNIWYRTTSQFSLKNGPLLRSSLGNLDPAVALAITDEACAYLISQFESRGYEVSIFDSTKITKHKLMKKAREKKDNDGAGIYNGSTAEVGMEAAGGDQAILSTTATGVNHFWLGPKMPWQDWVEVVEKITKGQDAAGLAISAFVDFVESSSNEDKLGQDSLKVYQTPAIRLFNDGRWGAPNAGYGGGMVTFMHGDLEKNMITVQDTDGSWITEVKREGAGKNFITFTIDNQKYRRVTVGVLKRFVDEVIAKYEEAFYGN